jgi:hypothetical protein
MQVHLRLGKHRSIASLCIAMARGPHHRAARALRPLSATRRLPSPAAVDASLLRPTPQDTACSRHFLGAPALWRPQRRTARVVARRAPVLDRHAHRSVRARSSVAEPGGWQGPWPPLTCVNKHFY